MVRKAFKTKFDFEMVPISKVQLIISKPVDKQIDFSRQLLPN